MSLVSIITPVYNAEKWFKETFESALDYSKVLATYRILENSKSRNKFKLIKYEFRVYHKTQKINWFKSWYYVFCWAINGKKKYKNVR